MVESRNRLQHPILSLWPIGIFEEYVGKRIQTFFLTGKAVDDIDSALVHDGSILALSAACLDSLGQPSGEGAIMRGCVARFPIERKIEVRHLIKGGWGSTVQSPDPGNGPFLLKRGVWIERKNFQEFVEGLPSQFWSACIEIRLEGEKLGRNELIHGVWDEKVLLRIEEA